MELQVRLASPFLVLPTPLCDAINDGRSAGLDEPPAYEACSSASMISAPPPSSSSPGSATNSQRLTAYIHLTVPTNASTSYSLTSLTAKLVGSESLAYNDGGFEQSCPIQVTAPICLPKTSVLLPGRSYDFEAHLACPADMPPSIQLQDARLRYKVRVKAKVSPLSTKSSWLGATGMLGKTLTADTEVTIVQQAPPESVDFSHVKYVCIPGLGSTCISISPSPCLIGQSTHLSLTLPSTEARKRISSVQLGLVQHTHLRRRSASPSCRQAKPNLYYDLVSTQPSAASSIDLASTGDLGSEKAQLCEPSSSVFEARFEIPPPTHVQPSTLIGCDAAVTVSHHMQMSILFESDPSSDGARPPFVCSWPITLAYPQAVRSCLIDQLPLYSKQVDQVPHPPPAYDVTTRSLLRPSLFSAA